MLSAYMNKHTTEFMDMSTLIRVTHYLSYAYLQALLLSVISLRTNMSQYDNLSDNRWHIIKQHYRVFVCDIWWLYCTRKLLLHEKWVQQEGITSHSTQQITVVLAPCAAECHFKRYRLPFAFKCTSSHTSECTTVWNNQIKSVLELSSLWLLQIYCSIKRNYL
jgi:hypothetical protein